MLHIKQYNYCENSEFVSRPNRTQLNSIFDRIEPEPNPNPNRTQIRTEFEPEPNPDWTRFSSGSVRVRFGRDTNLEFPQYIWMNSKIIKLK